jgi:hypothetical protein
VIEQRPNAGKGRPADRLRRALDDGAEAILTSTPTARHDRPRSRGSSRQWAALAKAGSRHRQPQLPAMPPVRRLSNTSRPDRVLGGPSGREIPDNQSATRLVSRRLATATLASDEPAFAFEVEQITTCIRMAGRSAGSRSARSTPRAIAYPPARPHLREFVRIRPPGPP